MAVCQFATLLLLVSVSMVKATVSKDLADDAEKYLLPWNIRPEHYDLTIYTNIEKFNSNDEETFKFSGISEITVQILYGDVDTVVLHTYDNVKITSANIVSLNLDEPVNYKVEVGSYNKETNKQSFDVAPALSNNGRYRITLSYTGYNTNRLAGFYRSSFVDENNNRRWLLTTQFENFGARQAYPCFDEPEYKSTYKLTLFYNQTLAAQGYRAFFNTDIESEQISNGYHVTTFKKTVLPMSSYLVAFIIAPFGVSPEPTYFNSSYNGENALKPFYTIGQSKYFAPKRQDMLSQVVGPAALNLLTKLTRVGYGYEKVEQAGIPDFAAGAMENWGLVTYREQYVFWNNDTGTTNQKQNVATVVTHELAHQWFGDLVTMHWWSDLWLNEGFATFFEYMGTDQIREPDLDTSGWDLVGQFVSRSLEGTAFRTDARPTSRPLTSEAYNPDVIETFGDGISYDKGGAILRMIQNILGSEVYYNGLNRYLISQEESVGTPEILLASWDGAIDDLAAAERPDFGRSIADLLDGWHSQAGYPVLSVSRNGDILTISQKRFLTSSGDDSTRWNVPITYSTDLENNFNQTSPLIFLNAKENLTFTLKVASADWLVINNQQTGYYRVNYDSDNWDKLFSILNDPQQYQKIHKYNRAQILDDAAALGASTHEEYLPYNRALTLLQVIKHDRSLAVWFTAVRIMQNLLGHTERQAELHECYLSLKMYFLELVTPAFNDLSLYVVETDSHEIKLLRGLVADFSCQIGLKACQQQARNLMISKLYHPDVRKVVLCESVRVGNDDVWLNSLDLAVGPESPEQLDYLLALTCTEQKEHITQLLDELLSGNRLSRDSDAVLLLQELLISHSSRAKDILHVLNSRRWKIVSESRMFTELMDDATVSAILYGADILPYKQRVLDDVNHGKLWVASKQPQICGFLSRYWP